MTIVIALSINPKFINPNSGVRVQLWESIVMTFTETSLRTNVVLAMSRHHTENHTDAFSYSDTVHA